MIDQNENTPSMEDMPQQHEASETNPVEAEQETVSSSEEPLKEESLMPAEPETAPEPLMLDEAGIEETLQEETEAVIETEAVVETEAIVEPETVVETETLAETEAPAAAEVTEEIAALPAEPEETTREKKNTPPLKASFRQTGASGRFRLGCHRQKAGNLFNSGERKTRENL